MTTTAMQGLLAMELLRKIEATPGYPFAMPAGLRADITRLLHNTDPHAGPSPHDAVMMTDSTTGGIGWAPSAKQQHDAVMMGRADGSIIADVDRRLAAMTEAEKLAMVRDFVRDSESERLGLPPALLRALDEIDWADDEGTP